MRTRNIHPTLREKYMVEKIKNQYLERLDHTFHPGALDNHIAVLGHGVTGNKDRPFVVALAQAPPPLISFPSFAGHPSLARVARAQGTASYQH